MTLLNPATADQLTDPRQFLAELHRSYSATYRRANIMATAPAVGELVAARGEGGDGAWGRGRVVDVITEEELSDVNNKDENLVNVFFVDSGHREMVEVRNIRWLEERFALLPFQVLTTSTQYEYDETG